MLKKIDVVQHILRDVRNTNFFTEKVGAAWAPSNVALCKYWGKRDQELNLPVTSSLSISLGNKGTFTSIKHIDGANYFVVNNKTIDPETGFARRLQAFLDLFRPKEVHYQIKISTNVPIAAGFASSACGFASLVCALDDLYEWNLSKKDLSILARLGSGSACRSVFEGFVEWQRGSRVDGMDSYGVKLERVWPELRVGALLISVAEKSISSREAMQHTIDTSPSYANWPQKVEEDLAKIKHALNEGDFKLLGSTAESNALVMHALMNEACPAINYSLPQTIAAIKKVQELRRQGTHVFFTQDAGPNLQLLFLAKSETEILHAFSHIDIIAPFSSEEQLILVDENDVAIGVSGKMDTHKYGKLHRAFSIFILRKRNNKLEILLQQRSAVKYHSANLWTNTCCGHPLLGENIIAAAKRRLREEMGFDAELKEIGRFHYKTALTNNLCENEIDHVLIGYSDLDEMAVNTAEVQNYMWVEVDFLLQDLWQNPNKFTVWFEKALTVALAALQN